METGSGKVKVKTEKLKIKNNLTDTIIKLNLLIYAATKLIWDKQKKIAP